MLDIEYHKKLLSIIQPIEKAVFDPDYIEIEKSDQKIHTCRELGIDADEETSKLIILRNLDKVSIFKNVEEFLFVKEIKDSSSFLIIDDNGKSVSYIDRQTYVDSQYQPGNFLITNQKAYLDFLDYLKALEKETDDTFCFVDFYNRDFRKICFVTLSERGRAIINYDLKAPKFNPNKDLRPGFVKFRECFTQDNKNLPKFLKSVIVETVCNYVSETRLKEFIENLNEIVEKAQKNFEVYLNNLSIEKIKKDYDDVKSKYFDNLSEILSKLSQKIIALPIGISATIIAIYNVKDEPSLLVFLTAGILVTSIYVSILLRVHFNDLLNIKKTFQFDYSLLMENNFFNKYPEEKRFFKDVRNRIYGRFKYLKLVIEAYYWIMNTANIFIALFALQFLKVPRDFLIIIFICLFSILGALRNYTLKEDSKEVNQ
jgi:hypothetical protein